MRGDSPEDVAPVTRSVDELPGAAANSRGTVGLFAHHQKGPRSQRRGNKTLDEQTAERDSLQPVAAAGYEIDDSPIFSFAAGNGDRGG